MNNVISRHRAPLNKDVRQYRRYSNELPYDPSAAPIGPTMENGSFTYKQGSGSGSFDLNGTIQGIIGLADTFVSHFWNNGAQAVADSNAQMLKKEERTNTILWVVIGLVLALLVFLVVRKTK